MYLLFWLEVVFLFVALWFLLAFVFRPLGFLLLRIFNDAKNAIETNKDENN